MCISFFVMWRVRSYKYIGVHQKSSFTQCLHYTRFNFLRIWDSFTDMFIVADYIRNLFLIFQQAVTVLIMLGCSASPGRRKLGFRPNSDSCLLYWSSFIAISLFFKDGKKLFQDSSLKWALVLIWIFTHSFLVYTLSSQSLYSPFLYWEKSPYTLPCTQPIAQNIYLRFLYSSASSGMNI